MTRPEDVAETTTDGGLLGRPQFGFIALACTCAAAVAAVLVIAAGAVASTVAFLALRPDSDYGHALVLPAFVPEEFELTGAAEWDAPHFSHRFAVYGQPTEGAATIDGSVEVGVEGEYGFALWDQFMTFVGNPCCETIDIGGTDAMVLRDTGWPADTVPVLWLTPSGEKVAVLGRNMSLIDLAIAARGAVLGDDGDTPRIVLSALPAGFIELAASAEPRVNKASLHGSRLSYQRRFEGLDGARYGHIDMWAHTATPYLEAAARVPWSGGMHIEVSGRDAVLRTEEVELQTGRGSHTDYAQRLALLDPAGVSILVQSNGPVEVDLRPIAESIAVVSSDMWHEHVDDLLRAEHEELPTLWFASVLPALPGESALAWTQRARQEAELRCGIMAMESVTIELPDYMADKPGNQTISAVPEEERTFPCEYPDEADLGQNKQ